MKRKACDTQSLAPAKRSARAPASPYSPAAASEANQIPKKQCWAADDTDMQQYHDHTWGRPETDESRLFESQTLQLMQCGVSWGTAWRQREHFRRAFKNYDVVQVASFNAQDIEDLMAWPDGTIIRNRSKLRAVVRNARLIVSMMRDSASGSGCSFAELLWSHCPANDKERLQANYPSKSVYALSRELKRCGFGFMGPTTVLSFMQVCHRVGGSSQCFFVCAIDCFRFQSSGLPMRACDTPNLTNRPSASSTLTVTSAPHSSATSARWLRSCSGSSRVKRLWIGDGRGCVCVWVSGPELQAAVKTMRVCDLKHFKNRLEASTGIPKQYCSHGDIHGHKVPALIGSKPSLASIILACDFSASKGFKLSAAGADVVSLQR